MHNVGLPFWLRYQLPTLWDSLEYNRVAVPGAVVEPAHHVRLRVAGHLLALHLQQHVLQHRGGVSSVVIHTPQAGDLDPKE
jgi:hypothetical protein